MLDMHLLQWSKLLCRFLPVWISSDVYMVRSDFWGYFEPIRQAMPANCSADIEAVIAHVDSVSASNDSTQINTLKSTFGLQGLSHNDDFAAACTSTSGACLIPVD